MINSIVKLEDIHKKYPFIYEVDEEYFYIGFGVCERCDSSSALKYYEQYKKSCVEIDLGKIISMSYDIDDDLLDAMLFSFRKVKAYSEIEADNTEASIQRKKTEDLIDSLSGEQRDNLYEQLLVFVGAFQLNNRRF